MFITKIVALTAMIVICCTGCISNQGLPPEEDLGPANISLNNLQLKMKQATDPKGTFRNSSSYIMKQQLITSTEDKKDAYVIITKFQKPKKLSITKLELGEPVSGQVINNMKAWSIDYTKKKCAPIEGRALRLIHLLFDISNPRATLSEIFPNIKLQQCRLGTRQYYKLYCRTKDDDIAPISIYVGKSNFLVKRVSFTRKIDGLRYAASMDRYNLYEGVMVAKKLTVRINNTIQSYKTIMYKLNPQLKPSDFQPPKFDEQ